LIASSEDVDDCSFSIISLAASLYNSLSNSGFVLDCWRTSVAQKAAKRLAGPVKHWSLTRAYQ